MQKIRWFILIFFFATLFNSSIYAFSIQNIHFPKAEVEFSVDDEVELEKSYSNSVEIIDNKDINETNTENRASLNFYRYDPNSSTFLSLDQSFYQEGDRYKQNSPLMLSDKEVFDIASKIPIVRCLIYQKDEPIIILYKDSRSKKKSIEIELRSDEDREYIKIEKIDKNSPYFLGYINTTTRCKKSCDGKLYLKKGDTIVAKLKDENKKLTRSLQAVSKTNIEAKAYFEKAKRTIKELSKKEADIWLSLSASKSVVEEGGYLRIELLLENRGEKETELILKNSLQSATYIKGSFRIDAKKVDNPTINGGNFELQERVLAKESKRISFLIRANLGGKKIVDSIKALFGKKVSNIASISIQKSSTTDDGLTIIGRVSFDDNKSLDRIKIYLENGLSTYSDQYGKFHFRNLKNSIHIVSLDKESLKGRYVAYECKDSLRSLGSSMSRFVDLGTAKIAKVHFCLKESNATKDLKADISYTIPKVKNPTMPKYSQDSFDAFEKRDQFLWPKRDFIPSMPSIKIAIMHRSDELVKLFINGKKVDMLNFDGYIKSADKKWVIDRYRGVDIDESDNILEAKIYTKDIKYLRTIKQKVHLSTSPVRAELIESKSNLIADGVTPPVLAIKLRDRSGYPLREGMSGTFSVLAPYFAKRRFEQESDSILNRSEELRYIVANDGIAYIELEPTTLSGEAKIHFPFQQQDRFVSAWLNAKDRDWIFVGFAKGSVGYNIIKKKMKKRKKSEFVKGAQLSFFAKGSISKNTLLTIAYNSNKSSKERDFFHKEFDLREEYSIYGDNAIQKDDAPSSKKLYLKIEKDQFYALFGDFDTALNSRELSRYSRRLSGIKSQYKKDGLEIISFFSKSANSFMRDEIEPDGTSGPYKLASNDIKPSSLRVYIESRDRYRDEIVKKRVLKRAIFDYSVDYQNTTIYFRTPISSFDEHANPQTIVVEYERDSGKKRGKLVGLRVSKKFFDNRVELGFSSINEEHFQKSYHRLNSVDLLYRANNNIEILTEFAKSQKKRSKKGYKVELHHHNSLLNTKAYYRYIESGFGLKQLSSSQEGYKKYGIDSYYNFYENFALRLSLYGDEAIESGIKSRALESIIQYNRSGFLGTLGYRNGLSDGKKHNQIISSLQKRFLNSKLKVSLAYDKAVGSRSDKFLDREFIELSYDLKNSVELFANSELLKGESKTEKISRVGVRGSAWRGSTIESSISNKIESDTTRVFGFLGLNQNWQIDENLSIDASYEKQQIFNTKSWEKDYSSYSVGAYYKKGIYNYNFRAEYKDAKDNNRVNLNFGLFTQLDKKLAIAFGLRSNIIDSNNSSKLHEAKLSMAYRDQKDTLLLKSIFSQEEFDFSKNLKYLMALKAIKKFTKSSFSIYYGLLYIKDLIDSQSYDSWIESLAYEYIYELNKKFELGLNGSLKHRYGSREFEQSYGAFFGYKIMKNLYLGLGYNLRGYSDESFSQDETMQGAYLRMMMKFDNESLDHLLKAF